jgi:Arc/MetJ-type ribon-helix-helix transcriptional regulator
MKRGEAMEIHLPPEIEETLKRIVGKGNYDSPDQAIVHAINLLEYWDELQEAQVEEHLKLIQEAYDSGPALPGNEVFARLRERAEEELRQER